MPLVRRIPKRGFTNIFRVEFQVVNLRDLERVFADGDTVSAETPGREGSDPRRQAAGQGPRVDGELSKKLTVQAHKFSKHRRRPSIEAAGGSCEVVTS